MYGYSQRGSRMGIFAGIPVTAFLIGANVLTFLFTFINMAGNVEPLKYLVFSSVTFPQFVWTLVTWPLVAPLDLIGLLFGGLWAYWIGGSLERSWGWRAYLGFMLGLSALTALTMWIGGMILQRPVFAQGIWLATAGPTVAWCALNAREVIRMYAVIPVPAPILAWLTVAYTWFSVSMSSGHPLMGLFALSGCAAAYWYVTNGRYANRGYATTRRPSASSRGDSPTLRFRDFDREPVKTGFDPLRAYRAWKQRRALEKLLKRSGFSDPDQHENRPR